MAQPDSSQLTHTGSVYPVPNASLQSLEQLRVQSIATQTQSNSAGLSDGEQRVVGQSQVTMNPSRTSLFQNPRAAPSPPTTAVSSNGRAPNSLSSPHPRRGLDIDLDIPSEEFVSRSSQPASQASQILDQQTELMSGTVSRAATSPSRLIADIKTLAYAGSVNENLICPICYSPFDIPVKLSCDHFFCKDCVVEALASQAQQSQCCPSCRGAIGSTGVSPAPRIINQMVDDLKVWCPFRGKGCDANMSRSFVQDHTDTYCAYTEMKCSEESCSQWTYRKDLRIGRCLHQTTTCKNCEQPLMERDIETHLDKHCINRLTRCPDCKAEVYRFDLRTHLDDCPEALVPCTAASFGCDVISKRKSHKAHASSCAVAKLAPVLKKQDEQLQAHEAALKHLKRKNTVLETSFARIQETLTTSLVDGPASTILSADGGPFDSTAHHLLCLHESLREEMHRNSATLTELDTKASMMVMNESLRTKEEFAHVNSAIGGLRMQLHWLTSARLQNQQREAIVRAQHGSEPGASNAIPTSGVLSGSGSVPGQPIRRTSDSTRQETKL